MSRALRYHATETDPHCTECQGGDFAPTKSYSPLFNDIWSLGIILLNLITGRNPWKSASSDDCTFQAYLRDPRRFLPTVLPISDEVNRLLVRTLEVDWRHRITLREMRQAVKGITNFYSPDVLFEDSMARCPWEAGVNAESEEGEDSLSVGEPQVDVAEVDDFQESEYGSRWSRASDSDMALSPTAGGVAGWTMAASQDATYAVPSTRSLSPSLPSHYAAHEYDDSRTPSGPSTYSAASSSPSILSPPVTPGPEESFFAADDAHRPRRLTLDIEGLRSNRYAGSVEMVSATSSTMQTALESAQLDGYGPYSAFYVAESEKASTLLNPVEDMGMVTDFDDEDVMDAVSAYSYTADEKGDIRNFPEPMSARPESPILGLGLFPEPQNLPRASPTSYNWSIVPSYPASEQHGTEFSFVSASTDPSYRIPSVHSFSDASAVVTPAHSTHGPFLVHPSIPAESVPSKTSSYEARARKPRLFDPVRHAFGRRSRSHSRSRSRSRTLSRTPSPSPRGGQQSFPQRTSGNGAAVATHWTLAPSTAPGRPQARFAPVAHTSPKAAAVGVGNSTGVADKNVQGMRRRATRRRLRSARDWFSPGKLFAGLLPSPQ